ncbi:MAG TPA: ABC transporter permease [Streptosporangiaceae bacterium]|nr:ABC transporter permease [Streptosporangiaceae bacterium]
MTAVRPAVPELVEPGRTGGLAQVLRHRYLLRLLVRRELKARYQGSVLGLGWSYVRPAVNFSVYFLMVGVFLKMNRNIDYFAIYLFSGMVLINFFTETLHSTTRSIRGNAPLIRKVYLPRELFPAASTLVSAVHFVPGLLILVVGALATGWTPSLVGAAAIVLALAVIAVLGLALGLLCAAYNVFFRDFEQVIDILNIVIVWSVPMIYPWMVVRDAVPDWALDLYLASPLVTAVSLFQRAFWFPAAARPFELPPHLFTNGVISLAGALLVLGLAQYVFSRKQRRFAEEL